MNNDLISRSELKKAVTKWFIDERYYNPLDKPENMTESVLLSFINNAPTVELFCAYLSDGEVRQPCVEAPCKHERPQGEWIENSLTIEKTLNCSICGAKPRQSVYGYYFHDNFCPECGADMRKGDKEE